MKIIFDHLVFNGSIEYYIYLLQSVFIYTMKCKINKYTVYNKIKTLTHL